ncbi:MAG: DMT family transporter [Rhodospirillaceae bacterium]|nr:DMT family transporter [Rhodospirillaceae bacterium]
MAPTPTKSGARSGAPDRAPKGPALPVGGLIALVFLWLVWGTSWPAMRTVFLELPVWQFRALTCAVAGAVLLALGILEDRTRWKAPRRIWPRLVVAAILNMTCWHVLTGFALQIVGAGHAAIVCYTLPVWTALLGGLFFGERIGVRVAVAIALGVAGVAVLLAAGLGASGGWPAAGFLPGDVFRDGVFRDERALGFAFVLLAAVTWAGGTLVVKHYEWGVSMNALAGWQLLIGLVPISLIAAVSEPFVLHRASTEAALAGLYVLFVGMVMGYALWFRVVRAMPATVASIGALMIPVIGVASGAILLGEPFGWHELLALALVLSAIALVLFVPAGRGRTKPPG